MVRNMNKIREELFDLFSKYEDLYNETKDVKERGDVETAYMKQVYQGMVNMMELWVAHGIASRGDGSVDAEKDQ